MGIRDHQYLFEVLGGATYEREERRIWSNYESLSACDYGDDLPFTQAYSLDEFPQIEDFEVQLVALHNLTEERYSFGYHVEFHSASRGRIASFPLWKHPEQDMCKDDFAFPLEEEDSYSDLDQGWILILERHKGFIYIVEGDFDRVKQDGYEVWCKVPERVYDEQWRLAIQLCREKWNK